MENLHSTTLMQVSHKNWDILWGLGSLGVISFSFSYLLLSDIYVNEKKQTKKPEITKNLEFVDTWI